MVLKVILAPLAMIQTSCVLELKWKFFVEIPSHDSMFNVLKFLHLIHFVYQIVEILPNGFDI